jgi:hypothetical protein
LQGLPDVVKDCLLATDLDSFDFFFQGLVSSGLFSKGFTICLVVSRQMV